MSTPKKKNDYVRKVSEETMELIKRLITENEQLQKRTLFQDAELARFEEVMKKINELEQDNEKLQSQVVTLTHDNTQLKDHFKKLEKETKFFKMDRDRLIKNIEVIEEKNKEFHDLFVNIEQQNNNLANLYVASYQLHGTLDKTELLASIREIIINLVGSEEFAIFTVDKDQEYLLLLDSFGINVETYKTLPLKSGKIGQVAQSGEQFINESTNGDTSEDYSLVACIPLVFCDTISGVIAIFSLLKQKPELEDLDLELFDLLATHAAKALYCVDLHTRVTSCCD